MADHDIKETLERHRKRWIRLDGVTGVAVGLSQEVPDEACIVVYVSTDQRPDGLEETIEGFRVEVKRSQGFRAL